MRKVALLSLFTLLFLATFANAQCGSNCLFYGGDFDANNGNANGLANETDAIVGGSPYGAANFQNFTNSTAWNVTGLFTNNLSGLNPQTAYWEVRTGVSENNGGTLVASGTSAVTQTPTGRNGFGFTEYRDEVSVSLNLNPDTYWMAVVPEDPNNPNRSFLSNTFGDNSVGTQTSDQQFFNSAFFGANYNNSNEFGVFPTFSAGVLGTEVPEPSSMIMLGSGLVAAAGVVRRRLSR
jgi:hypothetical protein